MAIYTELEQFVQAHRVCRELTWWTTPPTPKGYPVRVTCPCGVTFERGDPGSVKGRVALRL